MRLLLDTHIFVWWANDDPSLDETWGALIDDPTHEVFVSAATAWEIALKVRAGKWPEAERLVPGLKHYVAEAKFKSLNVTLHHAERAGLLDFDHKDPFDRLLAAQSLIEGLTLVSVDPVFRRLPGLSLFSQQH